MDALGWIIAIVLVFLFGRNFNLNANANTQVISNAVPTPDGLPFMTSQDTNRLNTANAPAPWTGSCQPQPQLPMNPVAVAVTNLPVTRTVRPVLGVLRTS